MAFIPKRVQFWLILILVCVAFGFRVYRLDDVGLAEDEVHKILAVESYRQGRFVVNAEHPMLMKLADTGMFIFADWWNENVAPSHDVPKISAELAVRFPNVVVGSLTTVILFLLARALLGAPVALATAAFWAVGINAITYNRIAKEDTFLVFFLLLALFCYQKAKTVQPRNQRIEIRWYAFSGAAFGLALASKYFPHYVGMVFLLYYLARGLDQRPHNWRTRTAFFGSLFVFFFLFNPVVLFPATWSYLLDYVNGRMMSHHGYRVMGHLYRNETLFGSQGMPFYFYLLYLLVKVPVAVLLLLIAGLFRAYQKHRSHLGHFFVLFMFVAWIVPFSAVGAKWLRYTLSLTPWLYMLAGVGVVWIAEALSRWFGPGRSRQLAACVLFGACFSSMAFTCWQSLPHYSLFVNCIGGGKARAGTYFPHDEFYDAGLREAVAYVVQAGPQLSAIYSDADDLVKYYANRYGRPDFIRATLCKADPTGSPTNFVLIQDGRRYFENTERIDRIERMYIPEKEVRVDGIPAVRIYRISGVLAGAHQEDDTE
ncbi:MAG: glycosyltransferase family 39 protein [Acidobacteriota bacterium]